jgi:hypothetical protein
VEYVTTEIGREWSASAEGELGSVTHTLQRGGHTVASDVDTGTGGRSCETANLVCIHHISLGKQRVRQSGR